MIVLIAPAKRLIKAATLATTIFVGTILGVSHAYAQTANFNDLMRQGDKATETRHLDKAIVFYTQAIKEQPKVWTAYAKRARLLIAMGHIEEARDSIDHWNILHPDAWSWYCRGLLRESGGNINAALSDLDRSCNLMRHSGKPFLRRSILRLLTGDFAGARKDAYIGLDYAPTWISGYELCSISDAFCGMQSDSISNLSKYSFAKLHKGSELRTAPQESSVIEDSCELTKVNGEKLFKYLKNNPPAIKPQQLSFAKATVDVIEQNYDVALKELDSQKKNEQVNQKLLRFYCLVLKGDLSHLDKDIHALSSENPKSDLVMDALDLFYFESGVRQSSIKEMQKAIALDPNNGAALYELTKIYRDLGDATEALKYCDNALRVRPDNEELLLIKSSLFITSGQEAEALKVIAHILAQNKKCGQAFMMQASIFTHQEKWDKAIESLSHAIDLKYNVLKALPARSACYTANHQDSLARKDIEELRNVDRSEWRTRMY